MTIGSDQLDAIPPTHPTLHRPTRSNTHRLTPTVPPQARNHDDGCGPFSCPKGRHVNAFLLIMAGVGIATEILKHDYGHAAAWLIVGCGAIVHILDDRTIRDLKRENASLRASRDSWAANARANTAHRKDRQ